MKKLVLIPIIFILSVSWSEPLPHIFLIGDSISIHYTPYLKQYLSGIASLDRKEDNGQAEKNLDIPAGANGGNSRRVLNYLKLKLNEEGFHPDYLLVNCGLHDIKRDPETNTVQINETDYKENLVQIFQLVQKKGIQPVWIHSTSVVDSIHNSKSRGFKRFSADIQRYNAIADSICKAMDVPVIDLYHFTERLSDDYVSDHVHYNEQGRALQAAYIAGFLQSYTKNK